MRNLKKILALVLALVMSLSLMATAGAASFPDVDDSNPYATAIEVLDELKVFQGFDDGTFKPTDTLNRAQAAVLVYRIATGDVENKYLDNYTFMQQSKFTDLEGYNWAKGYINYCQNAGIVVGTSATTFDPDAKVTGYQLLVMLLRTLGYGKAGEFADPKGWELQTATIAEREGITKKVTGGDFGAPAPRQMVAEILFRGLLTETVQYSALTPGGYTKGETLGKREFGLDGYEAVVVANEYANLNGASVLDEGETQVQVKGEDDVRTLTYGTKITDIGERRLIYTQDGSKVLFLAEEVDGKALNTVKEYGEGVDISSTSKFKSASEMNQVGTEFYVNFDPDGHWTCDQRLEFVVTFTYKAGETYQPNSNSLYTSLAEIIADFQDDYVDGKLLTSSAVGMTRVDDGSDVNTATYSKIIRANDKIDIADLQVIYGIFAAADNNNTSNTRFEGVEGDVYVGTFSTNAANNEERDLSNQISFNKFVNDYLNPIDNTKNWSTSDNGEWVKFIDNDNDGNCEYAFLTQYELQEVIGSNKNAAGDTILQYNDFDDAGTRFYPVVYMNGDERVERDIEVGDIVLVATIDSQILVSEAVSVVTSANSYSYKDNTIQAADGETYLQSYIDNLTGMQDLLASMAPKTEYEMFLDKFGFVRAYRQPGGTKYALVTELYYTNGQYGNLQQNWPMTAELTMPDENGNPVTKEYPVAAGGASQLVAKQPWSLVSSLASNGNYYNWLQPAIAHLGVTRTGYTPTKGTPTWDNPETYSTYWPGNRQLIKNMKGGTPMAGLEEFNYGAQNYRQVTGVGGADPTWTEAQTASSSFTNIAVVNGDDTVTLTGAAQVRLGTNGQPVLNTNVPNAYAVDYIQLDRNARPEKGASSYKIDNTNATYAKDYNYYVNADKNTEIYVVYDGGVKYFKGYGNMPKLSSDLVGNIHAAYAVARNTTTGEGARNYWIADVLVYEVEKWNDTEANSISLVYFTASQQVQTASSVTLETLNSKTDPAKVSLIPADLSWGTTNNWWGNWGYDPSTQMGFNDYGFYQLYNETPAEDGVMSAKAIKKITTNYNKSGIYAGVVAREVDLATAGYIPVNLSGATEADGVTLKIEGQIIITDSNIYSVTDEDWANTTTYKRYYDANNIWFNSTEYSQVKANDRIMWVGAAPKATVPTSASFIVDMGSNTNGGNGLLDNTLLWNATPTWVKDEWTAIDADQRNGNLEGYDKAIADANKALTDNAEGATNITKKAMQDAKEALEALDPDDLTGAEYQNVQNKIAELTKAIENWTVDNAKYNALKPLYDLKAQLAVDYANNPNLAYAQQAVQDEIDDLKADLDAIVPDPTTGRYTQTQIDNISSLIETPAADALRDATSNAQTALDAEPGTLDPDVAAPEATAAAGITVEPNVGDTPEAPVYDVTIPADLGATMNNGYQFDVQVKAGYDVAVNYDALPSGWSASAAKKAVQTASLAAEYVTWTITITKTLSAAEWTGDEKVLVLTLTAEPEAPSGDEVTVKVPTGSNVTVGDDPITMYQEEAVITLTAAAGGVLPDTLAYTKVKMVGTALGENDVTYTPAADKASATIKFAFGVPVTGNITIDIRATGKTLASLTVADVGDDGAITAVEDAPAESDVTYFVAAADADVTSLTQLSTLADASAILGTALSDIDTDLTCADNGSKLYAVAVKDGKLVAKGVSSSAIAVNKSTIAITGANVSVTDGASGGVITVDLSDGTAVTLTVAEGAQWVEVKDDPDDTNKVTALEYTFTFTLTGGFVAAKQESPAQDNVEVSDPVNGVYTVTVSIPNEGETPVAADTTAIIVVSKPAVE